MKKPLLAAAALLAIGASHQAQAASIDTLSSWDGSTGIGLFGGGGSGVYGETFTAPGNLTSFTFEVNAYSALSVVAQVYAWSGSLYAGNATQGAVGPSLFTSAPIAISGTGTYQAVTVDTGSVALTVGNNYVVLLADTGNDQGFADLGLDGYFSHPGVAGDGGFNFYNNDHSLSSIGANAWDDPQDYGSLAWDAQFAVPVTEPASVLLLGVGVTGLGVFHRRRRRRA